MRLRPERRGRVWGIVLAGGEGERIITVIGAGHRPYLESACRAAIPGYVAEQPVARGTGPGVFLGATCVASVDPSSTVVVFPSDHFLYPEERFLAHVEHVVELVERLDDRLVLLGAVPREPEPEYGWIEPGAVLAPGSEAEFRRVAGFFEKPNRLAVEHDDRGGKGRHLMAPGRTVLPRHDKAIRHA